MSTTYKTDVGDCDYHLTRFCKKEFKRHVCTSVQYTNIHTLQLCNGRNAWNDCKCIFFKPVTQLKRRCVNTEHIEFVHLFLNLPSKNVSQSQFHAIACTYRCMIASVHSNTGIRSVWVSIFTEFGMLFSLPALFTAVPRPPFSEIMEASNQND